MGVYLCIAFSVLLALYCIGTHLRALAKKYPKPDEVRHE